MVLSALSLTRERTGSSNVTGSTPALRGLVSFRREVMDQQLTLGRALQGKFVRFESQRPTHRGYLVVGMNQTGRIKLRGWSGCYAPRMFVKVDHPHTAAPGNS